MTDAESDALEKLPIWKEKYEKLGVTPRELYMRQNGMCYLKHEVGPEGEVIIHCTDGEEQAQTSLMLNPSIECVQCMMKFTTQVIEHEIKGDKSGSGSDDSGTDL